MGINTFFILLLFVVLVFQHEGGFQAAAQGSFARTSGTQFVKDGRKFYLNGFNAYWLMLKAVDPSEREKVTSVFQDASSCGMNVARTWAFSDGGYRSLQYKPGSYNEDMFKGLDFVISEARRHGIFLILSLVNNYENFGGRKQYVEWAKEQGEYLISEDDFYKNPVVKDYYKNHVQAVLMRINSITGVAYKDDPTIFAWELINEPRCESDLSGATLQNWITEMTAHVKTIDGNHLLEIGLEGFYGGSNPDRMQFNPGYQVGTDFLSNNNIPGIDFATIHAYPDQWLSGSDEQAQTAFILRWVQAHIQDADSILRKPLLITEFGKSSLASGYSTSQRDSLLETVYSTIYDSAKRGGSCVGGLFWQLLGQGMDNMRDGYEIILAQDTSTASIITQQSNKLSSMNKSLK
eukprot:TRINITY_DN3682_c4_g1_i1.p1 TRINITY_DN3682_c4_g1~~TRINITY_DN3682_c4_g1_i1.p1  ORF type:complete len:406 (+),score=77.29 TRINITY_DN3682_c4_g1_i1:228-1445(+)